MNATTTKGVFTGELQLSDFPNLGDWNIIVEVNGETKKKTFEIAEYVLPKYEVTIDTDKDVTYKDGQIRVTVRAKYGNLLFYLEMIRFFNFNVVPSDILTENQSEAKPL